MEKATEEQVEATPAAPSVSAEERWSGSLRAPSETPTKGGVTPYWGPATGVPTAEVTVARVMPTGAPQMTYRHSGEATPWAAVAAPLFHRSEAERQTSAKAQAGLALRLLARTPSRAGVRRPATTGGGGAGLASLDRSSRIAARTPTPAAVVAVRGARAGTASSQSKSREASRDVQPRPLGPTGRPFMLGRGAGGVEITLAGMSNPMPRHGGPLHPRFGKSKRKVRARPFYPRTLQPWQPAPAPASPVPRARCPPDQPPRTARSYRAPASDPQPRRGLRTVARGCIRTEDKGLALFRIQSRRHARLHPPTRRARVSRI